MNMDKKGFFFTLIVIAVISVFFLSYEIYSSSQESSIQQRILTMDGFLFSMEENLQRQIYTIGFRTLFEIESDIAATGNYSYGINTRFEEAFFNGTLYGTPRTIFLGATYTDTLQSINQYAKRFNVNVTLAQPFITVYQEDPWNVIINATFNLTITDNNGLARWNKIEHLKVPIEIEGFEDPLYIIGTGGLVTNKINRTIYEGSFVSGGNASNLTAHVLNLFYANSTSAPSFLDRLQGINAPSSYGIESLVSLPKLSAQGIPVLNKTVVDYIYFSAVSTTDYHVTGMPSWFLIDDGHVARYQVAGLTY